MDSHSRVLAAAIFRLLKPLARILLRRGISFGAFIDIAKRAYVDVAEREFTVEKRKQTISRIAVLTGLHRKEVARVQKLPPIEESELDERYNRAARVISGWLRDPAFLDHKGDPDTLEFEGENSFSELVKLYSGDMPPRAVADELIRVGAVELTRHNELRLTSHGYVPTVGESDKLQVLGTDTRDLIETIDHNITHAPEEARFQRKVTYDNVPVEAITQFRRLTGKLGQGMLEQLNDWLAEWDRDSGGKIEGKGRARLGLGVYLIEDVAESNEGDGESSSKETDK
ncbi:MAG: DUF6502 family protein [Gammaproteobacteria bacterium]